MIFFDTETCGLHGPTVLIQYAEDDGPVYLHSVFTSPIQQTLDVIENLVESDIVGFNLTFDWFHICQTYTTLELLLRHVGRDACPADHITAYAVCEEAARNGKCLKPKGALDLLLHARKGPYQNTMDRDPVIIKRVPTALAVRLVHELDRRIQMPDIFFAKRTNKSIRWQIEDLTDDLGNINDDFKNVVLRFAPSAQLKMLAIDALGIPPNEIQFYESVALDEKLYPFELGWAPYALAPFYEDLQSGKVLRQPSPVDWYNKWPVVISHHISHWGFNRIAREYALKDVIYTRALYRKFDEPAISDDDSVLACMVGASRWRGFGINSSAMEKLRNDASAIQDKAKYNFNSTAVCRTYLEGAMDSTELLVLRNGDGFTTKGIILEEIAKWKKSTVCTACNGNGCADCNLSGLLSTAEPHQASIRAQEILDFRHAQKEVELYDKLLCAGRFHASLNVIGTRSSRMSGSDGLNPQGIKRALYVRECFPLSLDEMLLAGGDFDAFEVNIADAVFFDPDLHRDLLQGKKIHALFGTFLFAPMTYEQVLATKGLPGEADKYARSKNGVFCILYGGEEYSLQTRVGISEENATNAFRAWCNKYKVWGKERQKYFDMFCSMRQPGGIGTKVEWHEPADYVESLYGFRRYFTLENQIVRALFNLAEKPPKDWMGIKISVQRRDRLQSVCGAVRSALFAAAFSIQAANMRAAANHVIQSTGGQLTKMLQRQLWDLQPCGINHWRIQPLNIHDEIMCPVLPAFVKDTSLTVARFVEKYKKDVPLLAIKWLTDLKTWGDKI